MSESFSVAMGESPFVIFAPGLSPVTFTIEDNDPQPYVYLVNTPTSQTPTEGSTATIEVRLNAPSYQDVTVPLLFSGSARRYVDYVVGGIQSLTIPAGLPSASVTLQVIDDTISEASESVVVDLGTPTNGRIVVESDVSLQQVIVIPQNDAPGVNFISTQQDISEGVGTQLVEVILTQKSHLEIRIPFSVSGLATLADYSLEDPADTYELVFAPYEDRKFISVSITDDQLLEPGANESIEFRLGTPVNAVWGSTVVHTLGIEDNDVAEVYFSIESQEVWENDGPVTITVYSSIESTQPIKVPFTVSGGTSSLPSGYAKLGTDFTISLSDLTIDAGKPSTSRTINISNDAVTELTESIYLSLRANSSNLKVRASQGTHRIDIKDNDPTVSIRVGNSDSTISEASGQGYFTISLSQATNEDVVVPFVLTGSAIKNEDFRLHSSEIRIPKESKSTTFRVSAIQDDVNEYRESITLSLREPAGDSSLGDANLSATLQIEDDDGAPKISWGSATLSNGNPGFSDVLTSDESVTAFRYRVDLDPPSGKRVRAKIDFGGTADNNSDYVVSGLNSNGEVEFEAGVYRAYFTVTLKEDVKTEPTETIEMRFSVVYNAERPISGADKRTIRILDNDSQTVSKKSKPSAGDANSCDINYGSGQSLESLQLPVGCSYTTTTGNSGIDPASLNAIDSVLVNGALAISSGDPVTGSGSHGFIEGAIAFFDGNFNGVADFVDLNSDSVQDTNEPSEPARQTQLDGMFSVVIPDGFDTDRDGWITPSEGRWILGGGEDISIGLPLRLQLSAPVGHYIISALSTLVERLTTTSGFTVTDANERVTEAFGLRSLKNEGINVLQATISGDGNAAETEETAVRLYTAAQAIADLVGGASASLSTAYISDLVFGALASEIVAPDSSLNLSYAAVVAGVIKRISSESGIRLSTDPAEHDAIVDAASQAIAAGNQAIGAIDVTLDLDYLTNLFKVKKVMIGSLAPAMREVAEGTRSPESLIVDFTGSSLQTKIDAATIGTIIPPSLFIDNDVIVEGDSGQKFLEFAVNLIGDHDLPVTVDFTTADDTAYSDAGDYDPVSGTLSWEAGDNTPRFVQVPINANTSFAPDINLVVFLSNASNAILGSNIGYGFILNDEVFQHATAAASSTGINELLLVIDAHEFNLIENQELIIDGEITLGTSMEIIGQDVVDDALSIYFAPAAAAHSVTFEGGVGGNDSLQFSDGTFQSILHQWTSGNSGQTTLSPLIGVEDLRVHWSEIESAESTVGGLSELILHLPDGTNDARLSFISGMMQLSSPSGAFEPFMFRSPVDSLVIRATNENFLTVDSIDPDFMGTLNVIENFVPDALGQVAVSDGDLLVTLPGQDQAELSIRIDSDTGEFVISSKTSAVEAGLGATQTTENSVRIPVSGVTGTMIIDGGDGNDELTFDFSGGSVLPIGGVIIASGLGTDTLTVMGSESLDPLLIPDGTTTGSGNVLIDGRSISFNGFEGLDFNAVGRLELLTPNEVDVIEVSNGLLVGGETDALVISGTSDGVALTEVRVAASEVVLDTTFIDGEDTVSLRSADNSHGNTGLSIVTGIGNDAVSVLGDSSFAGPVSLASQSIILSANVDTTANASSGDLTLTGNISVTEAVSLLSGFDEHGGEIVVEGAVLLAGPLTIGSGAGGVRFSDSINGSFSLLIESQGAIEFQGSVGSGTPLESMSIDAGGTTSANSVSTTGLQSYGNDLIISGELTSQDGTISISGTVIVAATSVMDVGTGLLSFGSPLFADASLQLVADSIVFGSIIRFAVAGSVDDEYAQLRISGPIDLADVQIEFTGTYQPNPGDDFEFIRNETSDHIIGNFVGYAEGDLLAINGSANSANVSYLAGDGNDFTAVIPDENSAPTEIVLSSSVVIENVPAGSLVAELNTADPDVGDSFVYTLVSGDGDADNASFEITPDNLLVSAEGFNYEQSESRSIRIRSTDAGGLWIEQSFTISILDVPELVADPVFGDDTEQRSLIRQIVLTFDNEVVFDEGAISLIQRGDEGGVVDVSISEANETPSGQIEYLLTFSGAFTRGTFNGLKDGYYELAIDGSKIHRDDQYLDIDGDGQQNDFLTIGDEEADQYFALYADTDGDGLVGIAEFGEFRQTYYKSSTEVGYNELMDFDGVAVGIADFGKFRQRYGKPKMIF